MATLHIHELDEQALVRLEQRARQERLSLNAFVIRVLEAEPVRTCVPGLRTFVDLDCLAGTWGAAESHEFEAATAPFNVTDASLWK
jgi:hypothetical protein